MEFHLPWLLKFLLACAFMGLWFSILLGIIASVTAFFRGLKSQIPEELRLNATGIIAITWIIIIVILYALTACALTIAKSLL